MYQKFINSLYISFIIILISFSARSAEDPKSIGKFKDWETFTVTENDNKICFAQSIPILRAPKKFERNPSRLFITFRPSENNCINSKYFYEIYHDVLCNFYNWSFNICWADCL